MRKLTKKELVAFTQLTVIPYLPVMIQAVHRVKIDDLRVFAAVQKCEHLKEITSASFEVGWGENRRQTTITSCGKCIPCRAKVELGQDISPKQYTH
jgi:hypothetical protein